MTAPVDPDEERLTWVDLRESARGAVSPRRWAGTARHPIRALREMIGPGLLATLMPIAVGLIFKQLGVGAEAVAALLMVGTITGIMMALLLNNGGGAWDNAKKYIETGAIGGKGSDTHKAAVVGDTIGDPFKDTAGPSLHVVIKLLSTITLVLAPLFI